MFLYNKLASKLVNKNTHLQTKILLHAAHKNVNYQMTYNY